MKKIIKNFKSKYKCNITIYLMVNSADTDPEVWTITTLVSCAC